MRFLFVLIISAISFGSMATPTPSSKTDCVLYTVTVDSKAVKDDVEKKMLKIKGVTAVEISIEESYIRVTYAKEGLKPEAIKEKIEKLGLNPQPLKCKPHSSYCEGDCSSCSAIKTRGRH